MANEWTEIKTASVASFSQFQLGAILSCLECDPLCALVRVTIISVFFCEKQKFHRESQAKEVIWIVKDFKESLGT